MRLILATIFSFCLCAIPTELESVCSWYISECQNEVQSVSGKEPCANHYPLIEDCDGTKETYWECVQQKFDPIRPDFSKVGQKMECCFYEEHKDLETYSYYFDAGNGKTPSNGIEGLELTTFTFPEGNVYAEDEVGVEIFIDWGDEINAVAPPEDGGCDDINLVNANTKNYTNCTGGGFKDIFVVSHINVHACLMTDTQTTCSIKFPQDTSVSGRNVQGRINFGTKGDTKYPTLAMDLPGQYKLMGHIRYEVLNDDGNSRTLWDIGMTKLVTVLNATTTTRRVSSGAGSLFSITALLILLGLM